MSFRLGPSTPRRHDYSHRENIQVSVRLRPPLSGESVLGISDNGSLVKGDSVKWRWTEQTVSKIPTPGTVAHNQSSFKFDTVLNPGDSTESAFNKTAKNVVAKVISGYNGCIFAYGQTNSGKTHTILGDRNQPGIIPKASQMIFEDMKNAAGGVTSLLRISIMEVYNENIIDLLTHKKHSIAISEDPERGVILQGHTEHVVRNLEDVLSLIAEASHRRAVGKNNIHLHASRSHCVFQLTLERQNANSQDVRVSVLNVVDLAGSEANYQSHEVTPLDVLTKIKDSQSIQGKLAKHSREGEEIERLEQTREREGSKIRKSLTALVRVVTLLSQNEKYIPYRDSKLTRLIKNALGGDSATSIICTINPSEDRESLSTLRFATAATKITNKPQTVKVLNDEALLTKYETAIRDMQEQLHLQNLSSNQRVTTIMDEYNMKYEENEQQLDSQKRENEELRKRMASLSKYILTTESVQQQHTGLDTHYNTTNQEPDAMSPIRSPTKRGLHRRHSFNENMIRCARSRELFTSVPGTAQNKASKEDDALAILHLSNSDAIRQTQDEITAAVLKGQKKTISTLEQHLKELTEAMSQSDSEKDQIIVNLKSQVEGVLSSLRNQRQESASATTAMQESHQKQLEYQQHNHDSAIVTLKEDHSKTLKAWHEDADESENALRLELQQKDETITANEQELNWREERIESVLRFARSQAQENIAMKYLLTQQSRKSSGCTGGSVSATGWKRYMPGVNTVLKQQPVLRDLQSDASRSAMTESVQSEETTATRRM